MVLAILGTVVLGYLLGNLNGAILTSRHFSHEDVRKKGSGNAGLTNFVRNFGASKALLVILMDAGKTVAACLLGGALLCGADMLARSVALAELPVSIFTSLLGAPFLIVLIFRGRRQV